MIDEQGGPMDYTPLYGQGVRVRLARQTGPSVPAGTLGTITSILAHVIYVEWDNGSDGARLGLDNF